MKNFCATRQLQMGGTQRYVISRRISRLMQNDTIRAAKDLWISRPDLNWPLTLKVSGDEL